MFSSAGAYNYTAIPSRDGGDRHEQKQEQEQEEEQEQGQQSESNPQEYFPRRTTQKRRLLWYMAVSMLATAASLAVVWVGVAGAQQYCANKCDTIRDGFQCRPELSHLWGQYSPFFRVPSEIPDVTPPTCKVNFANVLSRHGARDPTASKTATYAALIAKIQGKNQTFTGPYSFLNTYKYTLGADQLTAFGVQEMINSGVKFFTRYQDLALNTRPFIRAAGEQRVVDSATNFTQGYHQAALRVKANDSYPYPLVIISEDAGSNNTLNHGLCTAFETGSASTIGKSAQATFQAVFAPPILTRINTELEANLTQTDIISLLDLCPFSTVASDGDRTLSPFCDLFTTAEFRQYDYYQTLGKWYGYGQGNPFGATNGVGFINELLARLTNSPVVDSTSTNRTLDSNPATFPTSPDVKLFADFTHDNDITGILATLRLYELTAPLSNTTVQDPAQTAGYSAAYTVPFAARVYVEKFSCGPDALQKVRILVNDRVAPMPFCASDEYGMCDLTRFVAAMAFARSGGRWADCFTAN